LIYFKSFPIGQQQLLNMAGGRGVGRCTTLLTTESLAGFMSGFLVYTIASENSKTVKQLE
jgi:hypothetical protein